LKCVAFTHETRSTIVLYRPTHEGDCHADGSDLDEQSETYWIIRKNSTL